MSDDTVVAWVKRPEQLTLPAVVVGAAAVGVGVWLSWPPSAAVAAALVTFVAFRLDPSLPA